MMNKGYYNAFDPRQQMRIDREASETVLSMGQQD
jgi:hypothetical protein